MRGRGIEGVGLGWRPEIAADLLVDRGAVDFVEVIAEACFVPSAQRREAVALAEAWPVIPHGVKLSLGSAEGVDEDRARRLGALAVALRAPMITEHVALTSAGGCDIGHLTQLPRTREAVRVVARNVARARRHLPDVPLVLENVAWTLRWPDDAMREEVAIDNGAPATQEVATEGPLVTVMRIEDGKPVIAPRVEVAWIGVGEGAEKARSLPKLELPPRKSEQPFAFGRKSRTS